SFLVVVHVARGIGVLEEEPRPRMPGKVVENPVVALLGSIVGLHVLVEDAEIQQRPQVSRKLTSGSLVKFSCVVVVAVVIVFEGQMKERPGVRAVGLHSPLEQRPVLFLTSAKTLD